MSSSGKVLTATLQSVFTPEGFGAVGDGVTDDTAAVQAALTAAVNAAATGRRKVSLDRDYLCGTLTCAGTGVDIGGVGRVIQRQADIRQLVMSNSTDCRVKGLRWVGVGGGIYAGSNSAIFADSPTNLRVYGNDFTGYREDAVQILNGTDCYVERNDIHAISAGLLFMACTRLSVCLNVLRDTQVSNATFVHGIAFDALAGFAYANPNTDVVCADNIVMNYQNAQAVLAHRLSRAVVSGNVCDNVFCGPSFIRTAATDTISQITCTDNVVSCSAAGFAGSNNNYGINVGGGAGFPCDHVTITGNVIVGANQVALNVGVGGIGVGYANQVTVQGNTLSGCVANGIVVNNPSFDVDISSNMVSGIIAQAGQQACIELTNSATTSTGVVGRNTLDGGAGTNSGVRSDMTFPGVTIRDQTLLGTFTDAITNPNKANVLFKPGFAGGFGNVGAANPPVSGTTYRNNTGRFVRIEVPASATLLGTPGTVTVGLDTVNPTVATLPVRRVDDQSTAAQPTVVDFVVPPGCFWSATAAGATLGNAVAYAV